VEEPSTRQLFKGLRREVPFNLSICARNYLNLKSFDESDQLISQ